MQIKIDGEWHFLCVCSNCKEVHAFHISHDEGSKSGLCVVDGMIKCCTKPDNWCNINSAEINEFMKEYPDEKYRE